MAILSQYGADTATSGGVTVPYSVRPPAPYTLTNLTYTEIVSSVPEDWVGFYVTVCALTARSGIMHVCKGAAASEVRIATVPTASMSYSSQYGFAMYVPIPVTAGTRLSVGAACASSWDGQCQIQGVPAAGFSTVPSWTVMDFGPIDMTANFAIYGTTVDVDPGATANTKGAWTELYKPYTQPLNGNSLGYVYDYLGLLVGENNNSGQTSQRRLWDLAVGAAASETVMVSNFSTNMTSAEMGVTDNIVTWIPWGRAAGERISVRMQSSINDATDRIGSMTLFGVR